MYAYLEQTCGQFMLLCYATYYIHRFCSSSEPCIKHANPASKRNRLPGCKRNPTALVRMWFKSLLLVACFTGVTVDSDAHLFYASPFYRFLSIFSHHLSPFRRANPLLPAPSDGVVVAVAHQKPEWIRKLKKIKNAKIIKKRSSGLWQIPFGENLK